MNIGVLGPIFVNVKITTDKFDVNGNNKGTAVTSYSSPWFELAAKIAEDPENNVDIFSSVNAPIVVYVKRWLSQHRISDRYLRSAPNGTGFNIVFTDSDGDNVIRSCPDMSIVEDQIVYARKDILAHLDALIVSSINPEIVRLCKNYNVKVYWLPDERDSALVEDSSHDVYSTLAKELKQINLDNYKEVLR